MKLNAKTIFKGYAYAWLTLGFFLGSLVRYQVELAQGEKVAVQVSSDSARPDLAPGAAVTIAWPVDKQSILEA